MELFGDNNHWRKVKQTDLAAVKLADRHYSRQKKGSRAFMPPGRQLILMKSDNILIGFSYPYERYVKRTYYKDSWMITIFRNESNELSSALIIEAIELAKSYWPAPKDGIITFVDITAVKPKKDYGYCFLKSGFKRDNNQPTNKNLILLHKSIS